MPSLLPKKFPGKFGEFVTAAAGLIFQIHPLLIQSIAAEPMVPFMAAGAIVLYAINAGAKAMMHCK